MDVVRNGAGYIRLTMTIIIVTERVSIECLKYEGRSWAKCSTRRFVVAFLRFGTPILLVDSLFSEVDSANCQFDSSFYELDTSVCRSVVSLFRYGISSFRCGVSAFRLVDS